MAAAAVESSGKKPFPIAKILSILFIIVNIVSVGGGAFFAYKATLGWHPPVLTEEQAFGELKSKLDPELESLPLIYTMEPFKANLKGFPVRAIEIKVNVEMLTTDGFEELMDPENVAKTRDSIMSILSGKSYDDIESMQGKLFLKDEMSLTINQLLPKGIVKDIYFAEFRIE